MGLLDGVGKIRRKYAALRLEVIGQVRIVIERDAVRRKLEHLVDCMSEGFARLLRKAVDEIHVDGLESRLARRIERFLRHFKRLNTVDGFLHVGVEVLHAERHTVEAHFVELLHLVGAAGAGVNLDREFAALFGEREALRERLHHEGDFVVREKRGRAAAEMKLFEFLGARNVLFDEVALAADHLNIGGAARMVARYDFVAAAVKAHVVAEGNVHVERERSRMLGSAAAGESLLIVSRTEGGIKAVGGRVGGVAGGRHVELLEEGHVGQFNAAGFRGHHVGCASDL